MRDFLSLTLRSRTDTPILLSKSFDRSPTSLTHVLSVPQTQHTATVENTVREHSRPGVFDFQKYRAATVNRHHRQRNGFIRPFGTVPAGFLRVHIAGARQRTRPVEGWSTEQGNIIIDWPTVITRGEEILFWRVTEQVSVAVVSLATLVTNSDGFKK